MDIYEKTEVQMQYIKKMADFHKSVEEYNKLYQEIISVGEYEIK